MAATRRCAVPRRDAPEADWVAYVYLRDNPRGPHDELWLHSAGCRSWFKVRRDTRTHDILASAPVGQPLGDHRAVTQPFRLPAGGIIDRSRAARASTSTARRYEGYAGDTLASALLANGVHLVGRSFKYHRPRGIYSAGAEEPNALVQLARGARTEPNTRATTLELHDGLVATSQNCWPSVRFDLGAIANAAVATDAGRLLLQDVHVAAHAALVAPLRACDPPRRGHGPRAATTPDPDRYEHQYAHCDVLVIGGGPAGLVGGARGGAGRCARHRLRRRCRAGAEACAIRRRASMAGPRRSGLRAVVAQLRALPDVTLLVAHDGLRLLRRQPRRRGRARHRSSCRTACAHAAAAPVDDPRQGRGAGERRDRARRRVRQQRSARDDAGRRGAHVCQAVRRAAGHARRRLHQQRHGVCRLRSRCTRRASRSAPSSTRDRRRNRRARSVAAARAAGPDADARVRRCRARTAACT